MSFQSCIAIVLKWQMLNMMGQLDAQESTRAASCHMELRKFSTSLWQGEKQRSTYDDQAAITLSEAARICKMVLEPDTHAASSRSRAAAESPLASLKADREVCSSNPISMSCAT